MHDKQPAPRRTAGRNAGRRSVLKLPNWRAILTGEPAERARAVVAEIARALAHDADSLPRPALADGAAGRALFFGYLAAAWQDGHYEDLSFRYLNRAIDTLLTSRPLLADLYGGFTGVAWVAEH